MSTKKEIERLEIEYLVSIIKEQNKTIVEQVSIVDRLCNMLTNFAEGKDVDRDFLTFLKEYEKRC